MVDSVNQSSTTLHAESQPASTKAKKEKKAKNPDAKPSHPPTSEMVINAIKGLKERGGSSLQDIKKYIAANYKVDAKKIAPFIKKYLKSAVVSGSLIQTKGKGASGSFKLSSSTGGKQARPEKKSAAGKVKKSPSIMSTSGTKAKSAVKKSPKAKKEKNATKSVAAAGEKKSAVAKPKSPSKAEKSKTRPTKKGKTPKPKTAKAGGSRAPKKAAAPPKKKK